MNTLFSINTYHAAIIAMACLTPIVFIALHFITAGYGVMYTRRWEPAVNNRAGWVAMEAPAFIVLVGIMAIAPKLGLTAASIAIAGFFLLHYFQRSFIFPLLIKGQSKMPLTVILMGATFNVINAWLIGSWLFFLAPEGMYGSEWFVTPQFIIGTLMFFTGMWINIHSDRIVRHLRRPGDTRHYIPRGGMYKYVTSANYLGEFIEWCGFAILSWSAAGAVFALWTFANLAPRARSLHKRYQSEFGDEYTQLRRKYIIPFIY